MLANFLATRNAPVRYAELPDQSQAMRNYLRLWTASRGLPRFYAQAVPALQRRLGGLYPTHHAGIDSVFHAGDPFGLMTALDTVTDAGGDTPQLYSALQQYLMGLRFVMESSRNDSALPHIERTYGGPLAAIPGVSRRNLTRPYMSLGQQYDNALAQFHGLFDPRSYGSADFDQEARQQVRTRLSPYLENDLDQGHPVTVMAALRGLAPIIAAHPFGGRDPAAERTATGTGERLRDSSIALENVLREHMVDLDALHRGR